MAVMESVVGDVGALDKDIQDMFYELPGAAEDVDDIIHKLRESAWFQAALQASQMSVVLLSTQHVNLMLDKDHVDWEGLQIYLLVAVAINQATSISNAADCTKKLTRMKIKLIEEHFMVSYYPADIESNVHKKARWRSGLMYLGWEFARILELSLLLSPDMSLNDKVRELLDAEDWGPQCELLNQTIYYISGAMLKTIAKLSSRRKGELGIAMAHLKKVASIKKDAAKSKGLPTDRVESKEKSGLVYSSDEFYTCWKRIEYVFRSLLNGASIAVYGTGIVGDIGHALESFVDEVGFSALLSEDVCSRETMMEVFRSLLKSYCNLRGKDYAFKKNAVNKTHCVQTLRATLAVQALRAKEKRRKQEEEKVESGKKKGASVKTATEKAKVDKSKKPSGKKKKNNKKNNKKKKEDKVEAAQAAYDDAELMEMMNTVERNLKKINTTL